MSNSIPKPPSPCYLPSIQAKNSETVERVLEMPRSPPPEQGQDFPIGQTRKRAIAVFIVLTNLVPVRQPILL